MADFAFTEKAILLKPEDNIAIAKENLAAGTNLRDGEEVVVLQADIPRGHKFAIRDIQQNMKVLKYGQFIGYVSSPIASGDHVHIHNVEFAPSLKEYNFSGQPDPVYLVPEADRRTFQGFRRANGRAGTRNYVLIVSSVNCSASVCRYISQHFNDTVMQAYPNVDGVAAITHKGGCGIAIDGKEHINIAGMLAGYAKHPNVAGYVLIGLGCEINQISQIIEGQQLIQIGKRPEEDGPPVVTIQGSGGIRKAVHDGIEAVEELLSKANYCTRSDIPVSELMLATECGGSDGYSGITANPALGVASDLLVKQGGTVIVSEMPEIYGAEHLMIRRAQNRNVGEKLAEHIRWWEDYASRHNATINNNPTPGNMEGGITTVLEKSLGAVAKGGTTPVNAVYGYGEKVTEKGLVIMDTPGYDPVSITGMVAGGANIICFTTGRGSVYGCKPVPSIKIASNTPMYNRMSDDMDINAGAAVEQGDIDTVGRNIFETILSVASGERTKSEFHGVGEEEFNPWYFGPTL